MPKKTLVQIAKILCRECRRDISTRHKPPQKISECIFDCQLPKTKKLLARDKFHSLRALINKYELKAIDDEQEWSTYYRMEGETYAEYKAKMEQLAADNKERERIYLERKKQKEAQNEPQ